LALSSPTSSLRLGRALFSLQPGLRSKVSLNTALLFFYGEWKKLQVFRLGSSNPFRRCSRSKTEWVALRSCSLLVPQLLLDRSCRETMIFLLISSSKRLLSSWDMLRECVGFFRFMLGILRTFGFLNRSSKEKDGDLVSVLRLQTLMGEPVSTLRYEAQKLLLWRSGPVFLDSTECALQ
jgi:hypothetical protein